MNHSENSVFRNYETYSQNERIVSICDFLKNPDIEVLGIHISPYIKAYRIIGLRIKDSPTGIIIKKQEILQVKEYVNNGALIEPKAKKIIKNHLSMIGKAFKEAEKAKRTDKS